MSLNRLFKFTATILISAFALLCIQVLNASASYNQQSLHGEWIGYEANPIQPREMDKHVYTTFWIFDGKGNIIDMAGFFFYDGSYNVSSNGSFTMNLNFEDGFFIGHGRLTSDTEGYVDFGTGANAFRYYLTKISDKSFLQGTWAGNIGGYNVHFNVNESGEVSTFSGIQGPVTGRLYHQGGHVSGFFKTGLLPSDSEFNQFALEGSLLGNTLSGYYEADNDDSLSFFSLTKQDSPPNESELTDIEKAYAIFNWLESLFPEILKPSPQLTHELLGIIFRYYPTTNVYIATFQNHLFFIDHLGNVHDLGKVDFWLPIAQGG